MLAKYISTQSCYYSPLLDLSLARNYPEWDEGHVGTDKAVGDESTCYEEQGEMDSLYNEWDE